LTLAPIAALFTACETQGIPGTTTSSPEDRDALRDARAGSETGGRAPWFQATISALLRRVVQERQRNAAERVTSAAVDGYPLRANRYGGGERVPAVPQSRVTPGPTGSDRPVAPGRASPARRWGALTILIVLIGGTYLTSGSAAMVDPANAAPLVVRRQNAGGPDVVDAVGSTWVTDRAYTTAETFGFIGGTTTTTAAAIGGTVDDALYRTTRSGSLFSYRFDVPAGEYTVLLKFAETDPTISAAGQRVFNVFAESTRVLSGVDIFAEAGANTALDKSFSATVQDGALAIRFAAVSRTATVSAIRVISVTTTPSPSVVSPSPSPSPAPRVLTHGAVLASNTGSVVTAPVTPSSGATVLVYVGIMTMDGSRAAVARVSGGGARWQLLAQQGHGGDSSPRRLSVLASPGPVRSGPLTIAFEPATRTGVLWSVIESVGRPGRTGAYAGVDFRTDATVGLATAPARHLVAGFLAGTVSDVIPDAPAIKLSQSNLTGLTASISAHWSRARSVTARWATRAHVVVIAVEFV
jgi:Malectin domain